MTINHCEKYVYCLSCKLLFALFMTFIGSASMAETKAGKEIYVDIERQILIAMLDGEEVYQFDVVTGQDGKETTSGRYQIFRKEKNIPAKPMVLKCLIPCFLQRMAKQSMVHN